MKKVAIFIVGMVISATLCACSCTSTNPAGTTHTTLPTTTPTTAPTTAPTTLPTTEPSIMPTDEVTVPVPETNIPDPTVDGNSNGNTRDRRMTPRRPMMH